MIRPGSHRLRGTPASAMMRVLRRWPLFVLMLAAALPAAAQPGPQTLEPEWELRNRVFVTGVTDSVPGGSFAASHVFSLDQFLENVPGLVLLRAGSVGAPAGFSRFGLGAGRGIVLLDGIPLNDPQDGIAPLALIPTTDVGTLAFGGRGGMTGGNSIEGVLNIRSQAPPLTKPETLIELSKGTNDLKQRRARFSSIQSTLGIDIAYDELLNDGYQFDASGALFSPDLGRFSSRVYSMRVRGRLSDTDEYSLSFKHYTSAYMGLLLDRNRELRRRGHLGVASVRLGDLQVKAYEREFESALRISSVITDRSSDNQTVGAIATFDMGAGTIVTAGFEDLVSRQEIGEAVASPDLQNVNMGVSTRGGWRGFDATADARVHHQFSHATAWGGGVSLARNLTVRHRMRVSAERRYRLPTLEELFCPRYESSPGSGTFISGNADVGSEHSYELGGALESTFGGLRNQLSATLMRVGDPVLLFAAGDSGGELYTAGNGESETATVLMDRASLSRRWFGNWLTLAGGVTYSTGDRDYFTRAMPKTRVDASLSIGRMLFRPSTDMIFTAQFQHSGARRTGIADELPAYQVLNLKLDARLLDAHLYLLWFNVTNEEYQTVAPYLMTPRTFVYGIEWTIFS